MTEECVSCGKDRRVATRTDEGPICSHCHRYSRPETCVSCGHNRPVITRKSDGPRCQACSARPIHICSVCGERRPAHTILDDHAVCRQCYRQPDRLCGVCGKSGRIEIAATDQNPDVCQRCYQKPLKPCSECGLREPCAHDVEFFSRPGNEGLGPLDAETLARRRRMVPRPLRTCARCGRERTAQAVWPMGPVCSGCYDAVLKAPLDCPICGTVAALTGRAGDEAICGPCAGSDRSYECRACHEPTRAVADGLCPRCYARNQFAELLSDADDSWDGLRSIPETTDSPLALVVWLRRSRGRQILCDLISAGERPSHEDLPPGKAEHYLRSLLVEADVLDPRNESLERLPDWVEALVSDDPPHIQHTVLRFAQWHVIRRARRRNTYRTVTESGGKWARQQVSVARDFLYWLDSHGTEPGDCNQALVDLWLASGNTRRYLIRDFISWAKRDRLVDKAIKVPTRNVKEPTKPLPEGERWGTLRRLLIDEGIPDDIRVAGTLVLVYGQHLSRVVLLGPESVEVGSPNSHVTVAGTPLPLPEDLAAPLRRLIAQPNRGKSAVARNGAGKRWLFPGGNPGQHITAEHLRLRLAEHGVTLREARHAALLQWAQDTPGPILASALGLHINTAVAWRDSLQADYTDFVAARAEEVVRGR